MIHTQQVHSLTEFLRNSKDFVDRLEGEKQPMGLTVNGKVKAVLMDPETFEQMYEARERARFIEAIKEGEKAIQEGRTRPAGMVLAEMKAKYGF